MGEDNEHLDISQQQTGGFGRTWIIVERTDRTIMKGFAYHTTEFGLFIKV